MRKKISKKRKKIKNDKEDGIQKTMITDPIFPNTIWEFLCRVDRFWKRDWSRTTEYNAIKCEKQDINNRRKLRRKEERGGEGGTGGIEGWREGKGRQEEEKDLKIKEEGEERRGGREEFKEENKREDMKENKEEGKPRHRTQ